jgi:hypothetical protein
MASNKNDDICSDIILASSFSQNYKKSRIEMIVSLAQITAGNIPSLYREENAASISGSLSNSFMSGFFEKVSRSASFCASGVERIRSIRSCLSVLSFCI